MDLQICSACSSPTPVGSSIRLKTCQHSFCVLCLKYALIFGGAPDLQCPYPQGTFECGSKPNEAEVQYILEYDEDGRQDGGETGGNMVAIGALENALDRVLSIDLDEFPGEVTEELPREEESKIDMDLLLAVSDANLPPNMEPFECPHSDELEVTCPALVDGDVKCSAIVQDGAIRDLLTEEDFGRFQDRCLQTAEAVIPNTFHCLTPNCRGWVELIGEVEFFDCSICLVQNCVSCKAIHGNQSCQDYRANIRRKDDDVKSEATLKTMVETREGMRCPKCGVMITKIAGCDFMTCTTCKTGICWPTRGPRWGPAGQGDISGGCRCKVDNGRRCHPECEGCH
ncbi:hypothetical protein pipiens_000219, partial [Culex pipiens pipiens]